MKYRTALVVLLILGVATAAAAQQKDIVSGNCYVLDRMQGSEVESTMFGCIRPADENSFFVQAFYGSDFAGNYALGMTDHDRVFYVPPADRYVVATFGSSNREPTDAQGLWNPNRESWMTLIEDDDLWEKIGLALDNGAVLSYQIGTLGNVIRISMPHDVRELMAAFFERVTFYVNKQGQ